MMPEDRLLEVRFAESKHFTLRSLTRGVYACIHKPGGAAFSNAGIIDLGSRTLVLDTFHTRAAGRDLRQTAAAPGTTTAPACAPLSASTAHQTSSSTTLVSAAPVRSRISL
jgi:hypothetical protein